MRLPRSKQQIRLVSLALTLSLIACCSIAVLTSKTSSAGLHSKKYAVQSTVIAQARPLPAPARWRGLIGEYGPDTDILIILEKDGRLCALFKRAEFAPLDEMTEDIFRSPELGAQLLIFTRDARGRATQVELVHGVLKRRQIEPESGASQLRVKPLRRSRN